MHKDPDMTWEGKFPYDVLAPAGVTPRSNMSEILNSMAHFTQSRRGGRDAQNAWKTLSKVSNRLFTDFFLYRIKVQLETEESQDGQSGP